MKGEEIYLIHPADVGPFVAFQGKHQPASILCWLLSRIHSSCDSEQGAKALQNAKLIISLCQLGKNIIILVGGCVFIKKVFEKTKQNKNPLSDLALFRVLAETAKSSNVQVQFITALSTPPK